MSESFLQIVVKLRNELRGLFPENGETAGECVLRIEIGNTNVSCIRQRLDDLDAELHAMADSR